MITIVGSTHKGKIRAQNQDAFHYRVLDDTLAYAIVCDGMGGENAGNVASATAVGVLREALERELSCDVGKKSLKLMLQSAVSVANLTVYDMAKANKEYEGMGTTMDVVVIHADTAHIMHIGDSRVYLADHGGLRQLTRDHSVVQLLIDKGELAPEDAKNHPQKHYITRALGVSSVAEADYIEEPVENGSILLICSDGLSNYLEHSQIPALVERCAKAGDAGELIDLAMLGGGVDNITAVVVWRHEAPPAEQPE